MNHTKTAQKRKEKSFVLIRVTALKLTDNSNLIQVIKLPISIFNFSWKHWKQHL